MQKWNKIPKDAQKNILANVWCSGCMDGTAIIDYTMKNDKLGLRLEVNAKNVGAELLEL